MNVINDEWLIFLAKLVQIINLQKDGRYFARYFEKLSNLLL